MEQPTHPLPDVYSAREVAQAAGVTVSLVRQLIAARRIPTVDGEFVAHRDAVAAVRRLSAGSPPRVDAAGSFPPQAGPGDALLFNPQAPGARRVGMPMLSSTIIHTAVVTTMIALTSIGARGLPADERIEPVPKPIRLVYVALPGPGGGGGGGGRKQKTPPPTIERKGPPRTPSSPVPPSRPPKVIEATPRPVEPVLLEHEPAPLLFAPIASVPADLQDRAGVLDSSAAETDSHGAGEDGGAGSGTGTGLGSGTGAGVGPGSGGGAGGGPYRPGSDIQPPRLLREIKPTYSEDARRAGIEGNVMLEIVVRSNGTVGDVRVTRSLGSGLDERAVEAVRHWRFAPASRFGAPVDVIVEVAVEFVLR